MSFEIKLISMKNSSLEGKQYTGIIFMFIFHEGTSTNQYFGEMVAGMAVHSPSPSWVNYAASQQTQSSINHLSQKDSDTLCAGGDVPSQFPNSLAQNDILYTGLNSAFISPKNWRLYCEYDKRVLHKPEIQMPAFWNQEAQPFVAKFPTAVILTESLVCMLMSMNTHSHFLI